VLTAFRNRPGLRSLLVASLVASAIFLCSGLSGYSDGAAAAIALSAFGLVCSVAALRGARWGFRGLLALCAIGLAVGLFELAFKPTRFVPLSALWLGSMGAALWSCRRAFDPKGEDGVDTATDRKDGRRNG
jgi:hypothetical protein